MYKNPANEKVRIRNIFDDDLTLSLPRSDFLQCFLLWSMRRLEGEFPDSEQGEEKTSVLRQETPLTQQANFLLIRESWSCTHGHVCFYSPETKEREERSQDTPADLLIGWGKGSSNTLASWLRVYKAPIIGAGWGVGHIPFLAGGRKWGRGS